VRRASAWFTAIVIMAGGWAAAQAAACPLPSAPLPALAAVVRLLEPALPRSLVVANLELPLEHPDHEHLLYLRERRVLPRGVEADPLGAEAWQGALDTIAAWYDLPGVAGGDPEDPAAVAADIAALIEQARRAVRPAALIAWEPDDRSRLAFQGLVWNWSAYPRLIVRRGDPASARVADDLRAMARSMSTCAYVVESYLAASAPVARDLFLAENRARMYIVGSEPDLPGAWPVEVPFGEEVDVFDFSHPLVASLDAYSAVFVGDAAPVFTVARLLPQVRTNLSPIGIARLLALPPR
jgi:hypothetical protein